MDQKTGRFEVAALIITSLFLFSMLGLAVYVRSLNEPKTIAFTVAESQQSQLSWINCTRVTFNDGRGVSFQGLYVFEPGKTYLVKYLDYKYGIRNYPDIINMQITG
jgi:hypothetical protein